MDSSSESCHGGGAAGLVLAAAGHDEEGSDRNAGQAGEAKEERQRDACQDE